MTAASVWHFILWLHYVALSLWIGGILYIAGVAAPAAHSSMISKAIAGEIVGKMFKRLNSIEMVSCMVLIVTTFSSFHFVMQNTHRIWFLIVAIVFMGILTLFYSCHLTPRLDALKEKIPTLDSLSVNNDAKKEFDRLHKIYVRIMSLNLVCGFLVMYASVIVLK